MSERWRWRGRPRASLMSSIDCRSVNSQYKRRAQQRRLTESAGDMLPGTLDLLILKSLSRGHLHGYAIVQFIYDASLDVLKVGKARSIRRCTEWKCAACCARNGGR